MRILYASERPPYPFFLGGAARCAHRLLLALSNEMGVHCAAIGSSDYTVSPWSYPEPSEFESLGVHAVSVEGRTGRVDCGYPIHLLNDFPVALAAFIDGFRPDVVWSQLEGALPVLEIARRKAVQGLYFVHDAEFDPSELRAIAALDCHVVCSSEFLARKARAVIGRNAHIVYPCPETNFGVRGNRSGFITMINPHRVKGLETFIAVARRLPAEKFLLVESWKLDDDGVAALREQLAAVPNVRFKRRVNDMKHIYGRTRLLLVPSMWEEGFGMVAIEAQSCGIPVIASARGGLPESVGDGGRLIKDYTSVDAWIGAIGEVLKDPESYDTFATSAYRHARGDMFTESCSARRFHAVCSTKVRSPGKLFRSLRTLLTGGALPFAGRLFRRAR